MTALLFVLALLSGIALGSTVNTVRRMKKSRLLFAIVAGATLALVTLALSSDFAVWLSPWQGFLLGFVGAGVLLDWGPFVLDKPSSQQQADSGDLQGR